MDLEFEVVKLHDFPELTEEVAHLLNSEWPRSLSARCHFLKSSSNELPSSLLLLQVSNSDASVHKVVGHSRIYKVLGRPESALIESVIVDKNQRGCGLGRMVMKHSEDYVSNLGYKVLHLATHDKQHFYEHLGYIPSVPVSALTKVGRFLSKTQIDNLTSNHVYHENDSVTTKITVTRRTADSNLLQHAAATALPPSAEPLPQPLPVAEALVPSFPPPAPPLPPPVQTLPQPLDSQKLASREMTNNIVKQKPIIWMKKHLC